jgi:hypothetical protein
LSPKCCIFILLNTTDGEALECQALHAHKDIRQPAADFKAACTASGMPMNGKLTQLMTEYSNVKRKPKPDYSTRRKRRAAIKSVAGQVGEIMDAKKERCRDNAPENLPGKPAGILRL